MRWRRLFLWLVTTLTVVAVVYYALGGLYLYKEGQREQTWHDEAVANAQPQSTAEWLATKGSKPVMEWRYVNAKRHTYLVRLFDNRKYVVAVYNRVVYGMDDIQVVGKPNRFISGKISGSQWRRFESLLGQMYQDRDQLIKKDKDKTRDVTLSYSVNNAVPTRFGYSTKDYPTLPAVYREFDDHLFEVMQSWSLRPHRGYVRSVATINYDMGTLPNLVRGLNGDQEAAYPSIVTRMVDLGEPVRQPLNQVLAAGEHQDYLPISRYVAVLDGLQALGNLQGESYGLVNALANTPVTLPGRKKLKDHAEFVVGVTEINQHMQTTWALPANRESVFRESQLSPLQEQEVNVLIKQSKDSLKKRRLAAKDSLVATGPIVLPAVLAQLKADHARDVYPLELMQVLAEVGGSDGFTYAIRENGMKASLATRPLEQIGDQGVPGLLLLMESRDKLARMESFYALEDERYAPFAEMMAAQLKRNTVLYRNTTSKAVRSLHADAAVNLCKLLGKHAPSATDSINVLLATAVDMEQGDATRIAALHALQKTSRLPPAAVSQLRVSAGYASGKVHKALDQLLKGLGR